MHLGQEMDLDITTASNPDLPMVPEVAEGTIHFQEVPSFQTKTLRGIQLFHVVSMACSQRQLCNGLVQLLKQIQFRNGIQSYWLMQITNQLDCFLS